MGKRVELSPPAFRYLLTEKARKADKTIVLPEGNEPRTIKAAAICGQRGIAKTILLGDRDEILRIAEQQGIELNEHVTVVEPSSIINDYVAPMVEIRKNKGLTDVIAKGAATRSRGTWHHDARARKSRWAGIRGGKHHCQYHSPAVTVD